MRPPNAIDFWRGLALIMIFIDHVPGIAFENLTYHNIGISDAAELFVFLAGWALRLVVSGKGRSMTVLQTTLRLEGRAFTIFFAQLVITELALAITAAGSLILESPPILEWNNAAAVFDDPVASHVGLALLSHQMFFFDILPLYVMLMAAAPLMVAVDRLGSWLLLPLSLAVYGVALSYGINIPTWPQEGRWYFNPLAWQLVFALGFLLAGDTGLGGWARRNIRVLRWCALPVVLVGIATGLKSWAPDPLSLPEPHLFLMFDKTFASPARILHLLAVVALFSSVFVHLQPRVRWLARFLSMLGRNSLQVFCIGSLLSLLGQFARFVWSTSMLVDTAVLAFGIGVMAMTAWLIEGRAQLSRR